MERVDPSSLVARLEKEVAASPGGVVAFDGDGTLWGGDVGEEFFAALLARRDFRPPALAGLRDEARRVGVADDGDGPALAARLFAAYEAGAFSEETMCEVIAWACAGWRRDEVDAFARAVIEGSGLASRLHGETMAVVAWARSRGVPAFLVSASPRPIVEAAGALVGFEPAAIAAATAAFEDDVMLARVAEPIPYGPGKVRHLEARLAGRRLYGAFGDNVFDLAMLQSARVAVAVRPKARLLARAHEVAGIVELARPPAAPPR